MNAHQLKEEGNTHFKAQNIDSAIDCYTKALSLHDDDDDDSNKTKEAKSEYAVILKNRAACYLKKVGHYSR